MIINTNWQECCFIPENDEDNVLLHNLYSAIQKDDDRVHVDFSENGETVISFTIDTYV